MQNSQNHLGLEGITVNRREASRRAWKKLKGDQKKRKTRLHKYCQFTKSPTNRRGPGNALQNNEEYTRRGYQRRKEGFSSRRARHKEETGVVSAAQKPPPR